MSRLTTTVSRLSFTQLILTLTLCAWTSFACAQYKSPAEMLADEEAKNLALFEAEAEKLIGKTFWVKATNPKALRKVSFRESPGIGASEFFVTQQTSFKVTEKFNDSFLKVEFPDGKIGYIFVFFNKYNPKSSIIPELIKPNQTMFDFEDYIFPGPPGQFIATRNARQAKLSKAGVKVGMTASEVLNSSWGKPLSVNKTTTVGGVKEQWVYGGGNYLYFNGGLLSGIQN